MRLVIRQLSLLASSLGNGERSPPTVTPSRDAPARAIYTSTEYSLMRRLDGIVGVIHSFCSLVT